MKAIKIKGKQFELALIFIIVVILNYHGSIEKMFGFYGIGILFYCKNSVSKSIVLVLIPLIGMVVIGTLGSLFKGHSLYDIVKDLVYFTKPILGIFFGYLFFKRLVKPDYVFKTIIFLGVTFAIFHLFGFVKIISFNSLNVSDIREILQLANYIEIFGLISLILYRKNRIWVVSSRVDTFLIIVIVASSLLYFSRTMMVAFLLLYAVSAGFHRLNRKVIFKMVIIGVLGLAFYGYLLTLDLSIDSDGLEAFMYKIRMAPGELFIDMSQIENLRYLYDHWRGFEASNALSQMSWGSAVIGNGFGALVDLGKEYWLAGEVTRYIPIIHNGYVYILFKLGLVGLGLYLFFLSKLFIRFNVIMEDVKSGIFSSIGLSFVMFFILSTFVITGIYNQTEFYTFLFGGVIYGHTFQIKNVENNLIETTSLDEDIN
jgi:hypothetical protein